MDGDFSPETNSSALTPDRPLLGVVDNRPLIGELVQVEEKMFGEGRENQVFKATLKVGDREIPVVAKRAKKDRLPNDLSHGQIDEIRRELEKAGKLPMPYVYGKTPDGLLVQEYIPGPTLLDKLVEDPSFLDDSKRLELIEMALDIGSAVEKQTKGKYILKGISQDDILVAESTDELKVKNEGKLICVDPSIAQVTFEGRRESTTLEDEARLFTDALFIGTNLYDDTSFQYSSNYTRPHGEVELRQHRINALNACFVRKPEDLDKPRDSRRDLELLDKDGALTNFQNFCARNNLSNPKLVTFLFEVYHSESVKHFGTDEGKQGTKFNKTSTVTDFKTYFDSL